MKNNCDVSGEQTCCKNVVNDCEFMLPNSVTFPRYCDHDKLGRCTCVAAIREAIEADKNVREARLQALGFEPVSDEQRAENNAAHGLRHDAEKIE
jgi:hypothetical protein